MLLSADGEAHGDGVHVVQAIAAELDHQHLFIWLAWGALSLRRRGCHFVESLLAFFILRSTVQMPKPYPCSQSGLKNALKLRWTAATNHYSAGIGLLTGPELKF
jgi:hypothetical protein